eukprot:CAMPEP_0197856500 /NCGR_PEP_ID=MMETSP1438-20131217/28665_1 /TAXON_ID=1461541 /ORGANISM="Pterosperma sp., Strain CCMP1384" /LENGTH=192 /DNA_ID=CAMNT_0043471971 /DNA_START=85 /DNA_END=663 /DNA_ORIENTATION=+
MSMSIAQSTSSLFGKKVALKRTGVSCRTRRVVTKAATVSKKGQKKKVVSYQPDWEKTFFGQGLFSEAKGTKEAEETFLAKVEKKKVLSNVEKLQILTKLEKAGLSLSKIEQLGLLSFAEKFGLLSLGEKVIFNPGLLAAGALPLIVLAIGTIALVPDDSTALLVAQYGVAGAALAVAAGLFVGAQVISSIAD